MNKFLQAVSPVVQCVHQNVSYHLFIMVSIKHQLIIFSLLEGAGIKIINLFFRVAYTKIGDQRLIGCLTKKDIKIAIKWLMKIFQIGNQSCLMP